MKLTPVRFASLYQIHNKTKSAELAFSVYQTDPYTGAGKNWFNALKANLANQHGDLLEKVSDVKVVPMQAANVALTGRDISRYQTYCEQHPLVHYDPIAERERFTAYMADHKVDPKHGVLHVSVASV